MASVGVRKEKRVAASIHHLTTVMLLLLLQRWTVAAAGWGTDTEGILAVRQPDATVSDKTIQVMPVELVQRLCRVLHVLELQAIFSIHTNEHT